MSSETVDPSQKRFLVSICEIKQEIVFAEEFTGSYAKTVTLSDGTARTLELTPMMKDGKLVLELKDTGRSTYMGLLRVQTGAHTNGNLMVRVIDLEERGDLGGLGHLGDLSDLEATQAETRKRPPDLVPPPGFVQGIEILNDDTTPMNFVVTALCDHAGLTPEEAQQMMLTIHLRGRALIPTASLAEAQSIAARITADAGTHNYPLVCRAVGAGSS